MWQTCSHSVSSSTFSADEAPATAMGADDQCLSPCLPLHLTLAGTVPALAAGEIVDEQIYRKALNILANAYLVVTFGSCIYIDQTCSEAKSSCSDAAHESTTVHI